MVIKVLVSTFSGSSYIITVGDEEHIDELVSKIEAASVGAKYLLPLDYSKEVEDKLRRIRSSLSSYAKLLIDEALYDMNLDRQLSHR